MNQIDVVVSGACGRMGQEVVKTVLAQPDMALAGTIDASFAGSDIGAVTGNEPIGVQVTDASKMAQTLVALKPDVMVDFTTPAAAMSNVLTALKAGVIPVVGTTGFKDEDLDEVRRVCEETDGTALIIPNFAIGAVLLMKFAAEAARYLPYVEIIELHHDKKLDAPSGTAIKTAQWIAKSRSETPVARDSEEKVAGVRGGEAYGIHIHSVRLPGLVAHQEVLFGGLGQVLTLRHDSIDRQSFMPGVVLAVHKARECHGLVYGLENLL
ncbi:MAG: 4-hydroxy-tetrahydrodipicolinate reductase [Armatimonadetes bacterium]|nr:4-hydroxy-tetrahydrodipicolinate reductase [Armatimonadota bacterium]